MQTRSTLAGGRSSSTLATSSTPQVTRLLSGGPQTELGLQPKPFGEACYTYWQGGDSVNNDELQGIHVICQMNECIPLVVKAMRDCVNETGLAQLFRRLHS